MRPMAIDDELGDENSASAEMRAKAASWFLDA